jgi:hypothetical protein
MAAKSTVTIDSQATPNRETPMVEPMEVSYPNPIPSPTNFVETATNTPGQLSIESALNRIRLLLPTPNSNSIVSCYFS